ncbi:unnamed protein product, partial [Effrenium voratum]
VAGHCAKWAQAVSVLRCAKFMALETDTAAQNTLLSSFSRGMLWQQCAKALEEGSAKSVESDVISLNVAMDAARINWHKALAEIGRIRAQGLSGRGIAQGVAVGSATAWDRSLALARALREVAVPMLGRCSRRLAEAMRGRWQRCEVLLADLRSRRWQTPSAAVFGAVLGAWAAEAKWRQSQEVFRALAIASVQPDAAIYGSASIAQDWSFALLLLDHMQQRALEATCSNFNIAVDACEWSVAFHLVRMEERVRPDLVTWSCLAASTRWREALAVKGRAACLGQGRSQILCSTSIAACQQAQWQQALQLLHGDVKGDAVMYGAAASVCEKDARWQCGLRLMADAHERFLEVSIMLNTIATLCERSGSWEFPLALLRSNSSAVMFHAAIRASEGHSASSVVRCCAALAQGVMRTLAENAAR